MMSGPLRTVPVGLPDNYWMSPLRGNNAQDHERVAASQSWVIGNARTSNGFSQTHNTRS